MMKYQFFSVVAALGVLVASSSAKATNGDGAFVAGTDAGILSIESFSDPHGGIGIVQIKASSDCLSRIVSLTGSVGSRSVGVNDVYESEDLSSYFFVLGHPGSPFGFLNLQVSAGHSACNYEVDKVAF